MTIEAEGFVIECIDYANKRDLLKNPVLKFILPLQRLDVIEFNTAPVQIVDNDTIELVYSFIDCKWIITNGDLYKIYKHFK